MKINVCSAVIQAEFFHLFHCKISNWNVHLPNKMGLVFLHFACVYVCLQYNTGRENNKRIQSAQCSLQYLIIPQDLSEGHHSTNWLSAQLRFWNLPFRASSFKCKVPLTQELILSYLSLENWISQTFKLSLIFKKHFVIFFSACVFTFSFSVLIF